MLHEYFAIRISSTAKGQVDEDTENLYQQHMKSGRANESLKKLDKVFGFCIEALNQEEDGFCRWLWNQEVGSKDTKFIEMIKYIMTDFHLNCKTKSTAVNDEKLHLSRT